MIRLLKVAKDLCTSKVPDLINCSGQLRDIQGLKSLIYEKYPTALPAIYKLTPDHRHIITDEKGQTSMQILEVTPPRRKQNDTQPRLASKQGSAFNPFLNPQPELFITDLGDTHRLIFNKFHVFDHHLLIITKEVQPQTAKLTALDFKYTAFAYSALPGIMFFNGGKQSGASQGHKHLQVLPIEARKLPIFTQINQWVHNQKQNHNQGQVCRLPFFRFRHGLVSFNPSPQLTLESQWVEAYERLYSALIDNPNQPKQTLNNYNLFGCSNFLVMIPRKKAQVFDKLSANSLAFMGSVMSMNKSLIESLKKASPFDILQDVTFCDDI